MIKTVAIALIVVNIITVYACCIVAGRTDEEDDV